MATRKQTQATKRNVKKAQKAAVGQKTIAHLPAGCPDLSSAGGCPGLTGSRRGPWLRSWSSPRPGYGSS